MEKNRGFKDAVVKMATAHRVASRELNANNMHQLQTNHHQSMYSSTINSNIINHKQLVSYSFTIETTPISIFGITPYRGQLSISYQVREIIDAIIY